MVADPDCEALRCGWPKSAPEGSEGCPPARIDAPPEYATLTKVTAQSVQLTVEFSPRSAAGALPWVHETSAGKCGDIWDQLAAGEGTFEVSIQVLPAMMLAMPAASRGVDVSKDGKTMLPKPENGWSWAITPSIVR